MTQQSSSELVHLLSKLRQFRERGITLDELQALLWGTARSLTARDDQRLRETLQDAEGRVELARFTLEGDRIWDEVCKVVEVVEVAVASKL